VTFGCISLLIKEVWFVLAGIRPDTLSTICGEVSCGHKCDL